MINPPGNLEIFSQSLSGRPWDTKQYLPFSAAYVINGKAELRDYVGNAIWAAGLSSMGVNEMFARGGAAIQGAFSATGMEDPRDQEAIGFGYSWASGSAGGSRK
jgi:hypothetical protein